MPNTSVVKMANFENDVLRDEQKNVIWFSRVWSLDQESDDFHFDDYHIIFLLFFIWTSLLSLRYKNVVNHVEMLRWEKC